jgi:CheY-like chemotaxis protein
MNVPTLMLPSTTVPFRPKKKRVLLVDTSQSKRDLRAETMRMLGIEVDCAADVSEARCWWRADLYDLVLINVQEAVGPRDKFCDDMRRATPGQQIMFLVGKPEYLAAAANDNAEPLPGARGPVFPIAGKVSLAADPSEGRERWGLLEASRRISAVRHVGEAKARAIRSRPLPPRDSETAKSRHVREHDLLDREFAENA